MRFEHTKTGVWTALIGAAFWITGFLIFFLRFDSTFGLKYVDDWLSYVGTMLLIAGIFLIVVAGQIIRSTLSGETIQPKKENKIRVLICPFCSGENPEDARFCLQCGKKMKGGKDEPVA